MNGFVRARWSILIGVLCSAACGVGCRDKTGAPAPPPAGADDRSKAGHETGGHDHGHDDHGHEAEAVLTSDAIDRYGIKIQTAQLWQLRPTFIAPARVAFNGEAMAHVGSPLPGRIAELPVRLGDVVQKGDVLAVIESPDLGAAQSDYLQKKGQAKATQPGAELARNALERATRLFDQNRAIALDEVQKREAEYRVALASLQSAESAALAAENRLHLLGMDQAAVEALTASGEVQPRFALRAPLAGQVVQREVTLGELVSPEKEALMILADTTTLWVLADVPEARLRETIVGATAWIRTGSIDKHTHEGSVSFISPMVDARTRTAQVRIEVKCEHRSLWPGMFVQVEITSTDPVAADPPPTVAVPDEAVQTLNNRPVVFVPVPNEPNTFAPRQVTIGRVVAGLVPIASGLVEGEAFVAAGSFILKAELGKSSAAHEH